MSYTSKYHIVWLVTQDSSSLVINCVGLTPAVIVVVISVMLGYTISDFWMVFTVSVVPLNVDGNSVGIVICRVLSKSNEDGCANCLCCCHPDRPSFQVLELSEPKMPDE